MSIVSEFGRFRDCVSKEPEEATVIKSEGRGSEVVSNAVDCVSVDCCNGTLSAIRVCSWSKNSANLGARSRISFVVASRRVLQITTRPLTLLASRRRRRERSIPLH